MGRLKILARGDTKKIKAQKRGKLFEFLMAKILRSYGYKIDNIPNVNYAGMEIDIEGKEKISHFPLYAECKCFETDVNTSYLEIFYGKYMTRWFKNKRSIGLFIALPGINSHAKGWFKENIENNQEISIRMLEEEEILSLIFEENNVIRPNVLRNTIPKQIGQLGDWILIYSEHGFFLIYYVIPAKSGIPSHFIIFNSKGEIVSDRNTIDYLIEIHEELRSFEVIYNIRSTSLKKSKLYQEIEQIVEVQGSSSCFEYQFPASPEHFVGRENVLDEVIKFSKQVLEKTTSSRGILFEANSGWGKSSIVLSCKDLLSKEGHYVVAIDSRSASSSHFILKVVEYIFRKYENFENIVEDIDDFKSISGFSGLETSLVKIGKILERQKKILFIFLDQFEILFFQKEGLKQIRNLFFKINDSQTNIVIGFSWKTDLVGLTSEFPYRIRDDIKNMSRHIILDTFKKFETDALLKKLGSVLKKKLRSDLKFFLSEFSQGYPWLLKKLCAHVKAQIEDGISQIDIVHSLLNIDELFQKDLRGLTIEEDDTLKRIARIERISIHELGEVFKAEVVQSLVDRRLLVRIGNKYDIYWDIFRDYLITGKAPIQENYLLRTQIGSILRTIVKLSENNGKLSTYKLQNEINLKTQSFYNILRDLRVLGLVNVNNDIVSLSIPLLSESPSFEENLRSFLQDKLKRNRIISQILKYINDNNIITEKELEKLLEDACPYVSASHNTWKLYARIIIKWIDFSDLAFFDQKDFTLKARPTGSKEIRFPLRFSTIRTPERVMPSIQYGPIEKLAIRLVEAYEKEEDIKLNDFKTSTITKSLKSLENLGFIKRINRTVYVLQDMIEFVNYPKKRSEIFRKAALKNEIFKAFIEIVKDYNIRDVNLKSIGDKLGKKLGKEWKSSTAVHYSKIMINWVKNSKIFDLTTLDSSKKKDYVQKSLF